MKRMLKPLLAVLLVFSFIVSMTACGAKTDGKDTAAPAEAKQEASKKEEPKKEEAKPAEPIKLSFWVQGGILSTEEQKKPQEEWTITKIFKKFEQDNPGVTIEVTIPADQQAMHQTFKAAAMAKNGPDVANLWAGTPLFALRDAVLHLDGKIPQDDLDIIIGWDACRDNFKADGAILGYPTSGLEYGTFLYNKKLVGAAGLDFETNPPKTADEFLDALEKIKAAGVLPIACNDDGWNGLYVFCLGTWWAQMSDTPRIASNSLAVTKFAEDKGFIDSMAKSAEIFKKGYVNKDYATSKDAQNKFFQEKAALFASGNWDIQPAVDALGEENVGLLPIPPFSADVMKPYQAVGGTGQSLVVANYTKYPEMVIKLVSTIMNKENSLALAKVISKIPLRKDVTPEELGWKGRQVFEKSFEIGKNLAYWTDNTQVPEVMNEYYKVGTLVITGKMTPEEAAQKLDQKAAEINKK